MLTNELNLESCESNPCFYKEDGKSLLELHMDDIHVAARSESDYEVLISKIREHLAIVASPPLVAGSKYQHLKRTRLKQADGTFVGADQKHIKNILAALDMMDCKIATSPSLTKEPEDGEELDWYWTKIYRSCVGSLLYILDDRPDLLWDGGL